MKKNSKSTSRGSRKSTPKVQREKSRHSKSSKKPVTIDLTANKMETKSDTKPAAANVSSKKTSTTSATTPNIKTEKQAAKPPSSDKKTNFSGKTASASSKTPTPVPANNNGLVGKLGAAVVGGVVALGGAGLLQYADVLSSPGNSSANYVSTEILSTTKTELLARISGLEKDLKNTAVNTAKAPEINMEAINASIATRIKELTPDTPTKPEVGKSDLEAVTNQIRKTNGQITKTNGQLETLQNQLLVTDKAVDALKGAISTGAVGKDAGLTALKNTIDTLQTKIDDLVSANQSLAKSSSERGALITELQKQANNTANGESSPNISPEITKSISALDAKLKTLTEGSNQRNVAIAALKKLTSNSSNDKSRAELLKKIDALQSRIDTLKTTDQSLSSDANKQRAALAELQSQIESSAKSGAQAANAIAAAALKNDIDQGLPFADSIKTLTATAGDSKSLTALAAFAETGVPTITQLAAQFETTGDNILKALAPKPKDDIVSRLFSGAKSLVKTKSIKPQEGSSAAALVSQITAGLNNGELNKSSTAWSALPDAGKTVSSQWHDQLLARITANELVSKTIQSYLISSAGQ